MTCHCGTEWCWLCGRDNTGYVGLHFAAGNVFGCGGMQMQTNATPGVCISMLRRLSLFLVMVLAFCMLLSWLSLFLVVTLSCCICVVLCAKDRDEGFRALGILVACPFAFAFAVGLLAISVALIPFTLVLAIREYRAHGDAEQAWEILMLPMTQVFRLLNGDDD